MAEIVQSQQENSPVEEVSFMNLPDEFSGLVAENKFLGDIPFIPILESITEQFRDYINIEDKTNYVDKFYEQLHASRLQIDDWEEFPVQIENYLNYLHRLFIDHMRLWFERRLTITIPIIESESFDANEIEFIIRRVYEYFILGATDNFKIVISNYIWDNIDINDINMDQEFTTIQCLVEEFSPLITHITAEEFLKYREDKEMIHLFDNFKVVGNFLRKYSPKFYENENYKADVINFITMRYLLNKKEGI